MPGAPYSGSGLGLGTSWVLHDSTVYAADASGRLQVIDTVGGTVTAALSPPELPAPATPAAGTEAAAKVVAGRPVLADIGGRPFVLFPEVIQLPGRGTAVGGVVLSVMAVDPATRAIAWTASIPQDSANAAATPTVLGVRGSTLLLAVNDDGVGTVHAVDTTTKAFVWSKPGFLGQALAGDMVIAIQPEDEVNVKQKVTALSLTDGSPRWSLPGSFTQATVVSAGPMLVAVEGRDYGFARDSVQIVDGNTGAVVVPVWQASDSLSSYGIRCSWDQKSVTVCTGQGNVVAMDPTSGKELWRLPDRAGTRIAPGVTAVWHGVVYGTTGNGPVALDATTGQDLVTPAIAPTQVSATTAIVNDNRAGTLTAYPTTG